MARILIADDSELARTALKIVLLDEKGWIVCGEAENGRQAVLMAEKLKPDLIILDLSMPMISGLEAAAEILKVTPLVPIVIYTSHRNSQLDWAAQAVGVRKVISKGGKLEALLRDLRQILKERPSLAAPHDLSTKPPNDSDATSE